MSNYSKLAVIKQYLVPNKQQRKYHGNSWLFSKLAVWICLSIFFYSCWSLNAAFIHADRNSETVAGETGSTTNQDGKINLQIRHNSESRFDANFASQSRRLMGTRSESTRSLSRGISGSSDGEAIPPDDETTDPCLPNNCPTGVSTTGECIPNGAGYECECSRGYEHSPSSDLTSCKKIDICASSDNPCQKIVQHEQDQDLSPTSVKDQGCKTEGEGFECLCNQGFVQTADKKACTPIDYCGGNNECNLNISECKMLRGDYECVCKPGYKHDKGNNKECVDIDECTENTPNPCQRIVNDEKSKNLVPTSIKDGGCKNIPGSYECECNTGFSSSGDKKTCNEIQYCNQPGICKESISRCKQLRGDYECDCFPGYENPKDSSKSSGKNTKECHDIDECKLNPTPCDEIVQKEKANNELPVSVVEGKCTNTEGSYICTCNTGFQHVFSLTTKCEDINECQNTPKVCNENNSKCENVRGDYKCNCLWGYKHDPDTNNPGIISNKLCSDIDECTEGVQQNPKDVACNPIQAFCNNLEGTFECNCYEGYERIKLPPKLQESCFHCCIDIDECKVKQYQCEDICYKGIVEVPLNYTCTCHTGRYLDGRFRCYQCAYEEWGKYGECDKTCGIGKRSRTRKVKPGFGEESDTCIGEGLTVQHTTCQLPPCTSDTCTLSPWSEWGACNVKEGKGVKVRSRIILSGGDSCKDNELTDEATCVVVKEEIPITSNINWTQIGLAGGLGIGGIGASALCCMGWRRRRQPQVYM